MAKRGKGINYRQASAGSKRGISASQWNGFLEVHKDYYNGIAGQGKLPPLLRNSTVALATLKEGSDPIDAYQPVRISKCHNVTDLVDGVPSYEVEAVGRGDVSRHGNYGFTLGEGCSQDGGRIIVSGIALVKLQAGDMYYNKLEGQGSGYRTGKFDSSYYMVPDNSLSSDTEPLAPVGHYKVISWYDPNDISKYEYDDSVFIAIDMSETSTLFSAELSADIPAASEDEETEITKYSSKNAVVYYGKEDSRATIEKYETQTNEEAYTIRVYNHTSEEIKEGTISVVYSAEYNRFLAIAPSAEDPPDEPCEEVNLTWYETDIRCVAGAAEGEGELHQYKRQNSYALVCVLDEETGITKCCPEVLQGAWFYDRRIACEVNCCEGGEPPEYCTNCDECVDVYIQGVGTKRFKKTGTTSAAGTLYIPCGDGCCYWYMTDEEFAGELSLSTCWEDNGNVDGEGSALSYTYAIWNVTLYCEAGSDHADQDTYRLSVERRCSNLTGNTEGVPIGYRPPCNINVSGSAFTNETAVGTADKLCSEESALGQLTNPFNTFSRDFTVTKVTDDDCPTDCNWTGDCDVFNSGGGDGNGGGGGGTPTP